MVKKTSISLILLFAFFMLQAHNMLPHKHKSPQANSHSHTGGDHHHHDSAPENPSDKADHSAEFGKALVKPVNGKYELTPLKFIPFLQPALQTEISSLFSFIPQFKNAPPKYLLPPDPNLQGIALRGPPSSI